MTRSAFRARLRDLGPDLDTWPAAERAAARALLLRSAFCRHEYLHALEDDPALSQAELSEAGAARLCDRLSRTPQRPRANGAAARGAALAACVAVGLLVGWLSANAPHAAPVVYAAADLTPFTGSGE